jgi:hypothetical protein
MMLITNQIVNSTKTCESAQLNFTSNFAIATENTPTSFNFSTAKPDFVHKQMPDSQLFTYGENIQIGERCYRHHNTGNKDNMPQFCRIGKDQTSAPVYFLFGDSYAMSMANVFNEIEVPGMFAAQAQLGCHILIRPNMSSAQSKVFKSGIVLFFIYPFSN